MLAHSGSIIPSSVSDTFRLAHYVRFFTHGGAVYVVIGLVLVVITHLVRRLFRRRRRRAYRR
jgi:flagellar biogenesis protein FliO